MNHLHHLRPPTPKQAAVLSVFNPADPYTTENDIAARLGITSQAAIARLSGLVSAGWLVSWRPLNGYCYWYVSDDAQEGIDFFKSEMS